MKKIFSVLSIAALLVVSGLTVAHARGPSQGYYGSKQAGWNCPWGGQGYMGRGTWAARTGKHLRGPGPHGPRGNCPYNISR